MAGKVAARLKELGISLPAANPPAGNYVPWVRTGNLLFVSGQISMLDGKPGPLGRLGVEVSLEQGANAARACGLSLLAQGGSALAGDLDRIVRCVKVTGFVAATPEFRDHPKVVNGASDLFAEVLGEAGRHARAAVGMASLPAGVACEVEAIFEVR